MAGVRGFSDANLQMNDGVPVWKQITDSSLTTAADYVNPWYINYLGGNWTGATQCMLTGTNSWQENHAAWNDGTNDHWAVGNSPYSIGFYKQQDIPIQWALADNFVVGDMYQVCYPKNLFQVQRLIRITGRCCRRNKSQQSHLALRQHQRPRRSSDPQRGRQPLH